MYWVSLSDTYPLWLLLAGLSSASILHVFWLPWGGREKLSSGLLNLLQEHSITVSSVILKVRILLHAHLNTKQIHLNYKDLLKNVLVSTMLKPLIGKEISSSSLLHLVLLPECLNEGVWRMLRRPKVTSMLTAPAYKRTCLKEYSHSNGFSH